MEWHEIIVAVVTATPPTLMAALAWKNSRRNSAAVKELHFSTNSRLDQLLESTRELAERKGYLAGVDSMKKQDQDLT